MQDRGTMQSVLDGRPQSDADYYRKRAIQEQVAAQKATCPTARELHDELAAMYRFRVSMLSDPWSEAGVAIALQRLTIEQGSSGCMQPCERRAVLPQHMFRVGRVATLSL